MILQALAGYYYRLLEEPAAGIPREGTSMENISFALVLDTDGRLVEIEDLRQQQGRNKRPRKMAVPAAVKRSSGVKANFLWDTTAYVLGADDKGKPERVKKCHMAFAEQIRRFCSSTSDPGLRAVLLFLDREYGKKIKARDDWSQISGANLVFRLDGVPGFIHDRPAARKVWEKCRSSSLEKEVTGPCLVEGILQPLARLHPSLKGVAGAQSSGASIVAFNQKSFESYGKTQSFNAPVGRRATFAYTTALNFLLSRNSRQKVTVGDMTLVFWAERKNVAEDVLAELFDSPPPEKDKQETIPDFETGIKIRDLLLALGKGKQVIDIVPGLDPTVHFYLLGLSPNASRLSVRFWEHDSLDRLLERIRRHFEDISIVRQFDSEPEFPPLGSLLVQTAPLGRKENIPPVLAGGMARSMLSGTPYPGSLLPVIVQRIRADGKVNYFRAALIKGFLTRNTKIKEVPMALDTNRKDRAYVLGRLFAVLEKVQENAIVGAGTTVKDKYLASASATPALVFHVLLKNSANHIAKLRKDPEKKHWAYGYEKKIQEIVSNIDDFPKTLPAEQQGLFMIGYYHQRKDLFTKKNGEEKS